MQLYTINATPERYDVTEEVNDERHKNYAITVSNALSSVGIDGFTIQEVQGYWQGVAEQSYIITVACEDVKVIERFAESIRGVYDQDAVMIAYPNGSVKFIERP